MSGVTFRNGTTEVLQGILGIGKGVFVIAVCSSGAKARYSTKMLWVDSTNVFSERIRSLFDVFFWSRGYSSGLQMLTKSQKQFQWRKTKAGNKVSQYLWGDMLQQIKKSQTHCCARQNLYLLSERGAGCLVLLKACTAFQILNFLPSEIIETICF